MKCLKLEKCRCVPKIGFRAKNSKNAAFFPPPIKKLKKKKKVIRGSGVAKFRCVPKSGFRASNSKIHMNLVGDQGSKNPGRVTQARARREARKGGGRREGGEGRSTKEKTDPHPMG